MPASPSSSAVQRRPQQPARHGWWIVAGCVAILGAAGIAAWAWSRRDRAAELVDRQRAILAAAVRLRRADVDAFVRDADCLTRQEATSVRAALAAEWQRLRDETIARYFDAPESERPTLLDDDITRLQNYHRLLAALNPMDMPGGAVRAPRPARGGSRPAGEADANRRALGELYDAARAARAKERGIALPTFR
mgnify:CR=1 FL=1